eukprot:scaffold324_cov394-Prasinococcus_capsulatus_cf.AAC.22
MLADDSIDHSAQRSPQLLTVFLRVRLGKVPKGPVHIYFYHMRVAVRPRLPSGSGQRAGHKRHRNSSYARD